MTLIVAMASISFSVSAAQSFGVPQLPRFFSTASMGHNPGQKVDYYSAGQEYFTDDDFDFPKLERDVLNSRLNANHDTRPQFEKTQARWPRKGPVAHTLRPAHGRPAPALRTAVPAALRTAAPALRTAVPALRTAVPALRTAVPALRTAQLCALWPSSARTSVLSTPAQLCPLRCPAPRSQEAALHIYKEKRSQATVKYMKYAFVTYRWVKSLSLASGALAGAITGLLLAVAPARVLKPDIISFLVVYFGSLFGLAMNVIEKPGGYDKF